MCLKFNSNRINLEIEILTPLCKAYMQVDIKNT